MRYVSVLTTLVLAAAFTMFMASSSNANLTKLAGGSITGKVVDSTGAAVEGAKIRVLPAMHKEKPKKELNKKNLEAGADAPKEGKDKEKPNKPKVAPVAEGESAADGTFKLEGIAAGEYTVVAAVKGKGMGRATVTVADGQAAEVTIKLEMPAAK